MSLTEKVSKESVYNQYLDANNEKIQNDKYDQYFPDPNKKYMQPQNPVIPLRPEISPTQEVPRYPQQSSSYVPAIKFDHPVQINGLGHPVPISPAPGLQPNYPTYSAYPTRQRPSSEDGFIPLFLPDKNDPVLSSVQQQNNLQLPPEGYTLPQYWQYCTIATYKIEATKSKMLNHGSEKIIPQVLSP